jgi:hypothetical protein
MITLHLGYHKTGTTWLQECFFPRLTNVEYLSKKTVKIRGKFNTTVDVLDENLAVSFIEKTAALVAEPIRFLISNENYMKARPAVLFDAILKNLGPNTRVVFSIRRQDQIMFSRWRWQNIDKVWYKNFDIYKEINELFETRDISKLDDIFYYYNYNRLLDEALKFFPRERVHFVVYEKLFKNPEPELAKLAKFVGANFPKINYKSLIKIKVVKGNYTNKFKSKYYEFLDEIRNLYFDVNKEFSERTGITLNKEGYYE